MLWRAMAAKELEVPWDETDFAPGDRLMHRTGSEGKEHVVVQVDRFIRRDNPITRVKLVPYDEYEESARYA